MEKFNFYSEYTDLSKYLSSRQFKKLIIALSDYAKNKTIPNNLPNKTIIAFMQIKTYIDDEWTEYEKELNKESLSTIRSKAGKKGMKHRWGITKITNG